MDFDELVCTYSVSKTFINITTIFVRTHNLTLNLNPGMTKKRCPKFLLRAPASKHIIIIIGQHQNFKFTHDAFDAVHEKKKKCIDLSQMQMSGQALWLSDLTCNMADLSEQCLAQDGEMEITPLFHFNGIG